MPDVVTDDGVRLAYEERGTGRPLIILTGISLTRAPFIHQLDGLSDRYRVICFDPRGHGDSAKPSHGYRLARLARDLEELRQSLGLDKVSLLCWSMGCSVAWSYYDQFGPGRLDRLILVDGTVRMCRTPDMTEQDVADTGAPWTPQEALGVIGALRADPQAWHRAFAPVLFTDENADPEWLIAEALKMPAEYLATLMFDYVFSDWRDVLPRITVPTLVVGAERSHVSAAAQERLHHAIPNSKLAIMKGGAHLMFYEEPQTFNDIVAAFLG
jgi:non-heme chloroperoxidase